MMKFGARWIGLKTATLVCATLVVCAPEAAAERPPQAQTMEVTGVGADTATFTGTVDPNGSETTYRFLYGSGELDAQTPPAPAGSGDEPVTVTATMTNLTPDTTYRVEIVAAGPRHERSGGQVTFRTAAAPPPAPPGPPAPSGPFAPADPASPGAGGVLMAPPPVFGERVNVMVRQGTVEVSSGGGPFVRIRGFASIPVGSMLNTRKGVVSVTSALPPAGRRAAGVRATSAQATVRTQTGIFHGGLFDVLQSKRGGGMTEMVIRGRLRCPRPGASVTRVGKRRKRPRSLWGNVTKGEFRIRGGNSVASVRGTSWYVEDRCDGTLTRVRRGSVRVYDRVRRRVVIVRAGERYLARDRR
jgi:hypothetical protein